MVFIKTTFFNVFTYERNFIKCEILRLYRVTMTTDFTKDCKTTSVNCAGVWWVIQIFTEFTERGFNIFRDR